MKRVIRKEWEETYVRLEKMHTKWFANHCISIFSQCLNRDWVEKKWPWNSIARFMNPGCLFFF